ncbi:MAG: M23 family metallopeptidase [Methylovulum sp.]|nr:M23 family metallopeptidase [Methylovulum sp.]
MMTNPARKYLLTGLLAVGLGAYFIPEGQRRIPVAGASFKDWRPVSFWYYPWGRSGVHKGIDIFAREGTPVLAATGGLVVYSGKITMGGNIVLVLGAKWRSYYYAHLKDIAVPAGQWLNTGEILGTVGSTGNAQGKPPHLHFAINSFFPLLGQYDPRLPQAWKKVFYIDPNAFLRNADSP